jgi:Ni/Fe-hydrogenase 1 B-type cytochrome subunit
MASLKSYAVWDRPTRWFHWINALSVLALAAVGLVLLNGSALGLSNAGKVSLKTLHVWIGYVFVLNLIWRIVWAFLGNHHARWRQLLPGGPGYWRALRSYVAAFAGGHPQHYAGHNPLGRIGVTLLLVLLSIQAGTGLLLAGTDLFYPPLGAWFAQSVAAPGVEPATLVPYAPELYDAQAYAQMRELRKPFATLHLYGFYVLVFTAILHIAAVIVTELREGGSLISAMFTGRKILDARPRDETNP